MLPVEIQAKELEAFGATMGRYAALTQKPIAQVLEKKGRDVSIRMYTGFASRQFGGRPKVRGIAKAEALSRFEKGEGITVRASIVAWADERRVKLAKARVRIIARRKAGEPVEKAAKAFANNLELRANLWREAVEREIAARARGIGFLAAGWLWYRYRSNQERGQFLVRNKTGRPLGMVERTENSIKITNFAPFAQELSDRYGIAAGALSAVRGDTDNFIRSRYLGLFQEAARGGLAA